MLEGGVGADSRTSDQKDGAQGGWSSEVLRTGPPEAARDRKWEEKMRSRLVILLAVAAVCVSAGWAGWAPEEQISSNRYNNNLDQSCGHKVVVASNGVRHVVWAANSTIYYKRFYPASGWTPDTQLTTIKNSCVPSIALDSNGTDIHVVWAGDVVVKKLAITRIYYMKCVPSSSGNGGWAGPPTALTPGVDSVMVYKSTSIASYRDQANVAHVGVTWFIDLQCCASPAPCVDTIGFRECVGGTWGPPVYFTFEADGAQ